MLLKITERVEEPRPRITNHSAEVVITSPLSLGTLYAAIKEAATDPRIPPWAGVQIFYSSEPKLAIFWQTTDAGTRVSA